MNQQLTLPLVTDENLGKTSVTTSVPDALTSHDFEVASTSVSSKMHYLQRFCDRASLTPFVETYTPSRRTKKYFRISWREGKRVKHVHIPGGNVNAPLAKYRAEKLQAMCDRGAELAEIIAAVNTYRGVKS